MYLSTEAKRLINLISEHPGITLSEIDAILGCNKGGHLKHLFSHGLIRREKTGRGASGKLCFQYYPPLDDQPAAQTTIPIDPAAAKETSLRYSAKAHRVAAESDERAADEIKAARETLARLVGGSHE